MWIEKEIKENHTHGGALSKQVNDDIELLKKSNKFLYENGNRNLFCESMKRDYNQSLRTCSTIDLNRSLDENKKMNTSLLVSGYFRDKLSKKNSNKLISSRRQNANSEESQFGDKYKIEQLKKKKINNETLYCDNYKNKTICYQSDLKINKEDLDEFFNIANVNNVKKKNEFSFGKNDHNMFGDKHSNSILESKNKNIYNLNGSTYKNTQYLNNSYIYNDSIVNNNTVLYKEYNSIKDVRAFEKEIDISKGNDKENNLNAHKINKYPILTNKKMPFTEIINDISPPKCVEHSNNEITQVLNHRKENNNKQSELLRVKNFICKGVPGIIRNSANSCFSTNVDKNVQNKIEKHIMHFLENNLIEILEKKNLSCFETDNNNNSISDKISESINLEIKKNIDKAYKNINENMNTNMNDEIKKNVDILNNSLSENINSKIKNNIEELYDKLNENVLENISNNMENNLYKNVNNELKRKIDIVEKKIDINVNDNINKELEKKIVFLNDQINENISKELKKYISILSRNINEYLSDTIEKNTKIMSKNLGLNLGEEIKNNIIIMEKNIDYNINEENIQRNFKKIYEMYNMSTIEDIKRIIINAKEHQNQDENENKNKNDIEDIKNNMNIMMGKINTESITEELKIHLQTFGNKIDEKISIINENKLNHKNDNIKEITDQVIKSTELKLTLFAKEIEKNTFHFFYTSLKDILGDSTKIENEKIEKNIICYVKKSLDEQTQKLTNELDSSMFNKLLNELKSFNKLQINEKDIIDNIKNSLLPFQQNVSDSLKGNTIALKDINNTILKMEKENKFEFNSVLDKIDVNISNKINDKAKEMLTTIDEALLGKVANIEGTIEEIKKKMNGAICQIGEINLQMLSIPNEDKINKIIIDFNKNRDQKFFEAKEIIRENKIQITSILKELKKKKKTDSKTEFKKMLQNILDINPRNYEQDKKAIHNSNLIPQNYCKDNHENNYLLNNQPQKETKINMNKYNIQKIYKKNIDVKETQLNLKHKNIYYKNKINLYKQYKQHFNPENNSLKKKLYTPNKSNQINRKKRKPIYIVNYMKNDNNDLIEVSNYLKKRTIRKIHL
ncbi:conserved Plasmodium protein, unknown function [Plasmodium berghei]|uniref:Uncharacterized protein n=2 Tax=Plasmodium berghei TaxID=5821 RepID=A0A509AJX4_PLABA|nr:conserved Plasmodium protein, unknown function [Plasmodium berghei ANKA]CXI43863.1 conserved Plasmodium protein, unknown function [Plasmodium berghei]SCM22410.1 conserved Plasmodium protein, unknown function [Plasmodium berghei]SCN25431.1 conserved Plasmodium protein, unknown function [Plasmodium berghei]SCO62174.1 conserved Plasmodium protein, unknown function [Plasmodium berghei]VUC55816.1 conserved Plasmodium protein, unknown function [Plasmodium berghei ANKA]|eukprot:XP_034421626.1 conserved Plasmodium protein, unknown function [Plasmodium berghei ANKA]